MHLTHFKRIADKYHWALLAHRIRETIDGETRHVEKTIPFFMTEPRKVLAKDNKGLIFETNVNGEIRKSGLRWPKASEIKVNYSGSRLIVEINTIIPKDENMGRTEDGVHTMVYELINQDELLQLKEA